ncbi:hypothetical protein BH23ACT2_BH23ACT2_25330 [soil metagenome]
MATGTGDRGDTARLVELVVADPPDAWTAAGFTVDDDAVRIGDVRIRLVGPVEGTTGIVRWALTGLDGVGDDLDGLPTDVIDQPDLGGGRNDVTTPASAARPPGDPTPHPNGVTGIDHVVVATPDLDRTIGALDTVGLRCRRIRNTTSNQTPMRQAFFRLGPVVLEVVGGDTGTGESAADVPAQWFGLALDVTDLDATAAHLGDGLGAVRPAVQEGRRIATLRHRSLGLSVSLAAMDHHGDR